jgi:hypothetical protein
MAQSLSDHLRSRPYSFWFSAYLLRIDSCHLKDLRKHQSLLQTEVHSPETLLTVEYVVEVSWPVLSGILDSVSKTARWAAVS